MPTILFTKASVLLQLLQIFVTEKRSGKWYILQTLIWGNAVFFILCFFLEIFECIPREKIWHPPLQGHCIDIQRTFVATAAINICSDFSILIMPLFWVWRLRLQMKKKAKISLVFTAGLLYVYHHPGHRVLSDKTLVPASQASCGL